MTTNPHEDQPNDTRRDDLEKMLSEFGKAYGKGQNSRPAAAQAALEASVQGIAGPNDAKELWTLYQKAAAKVKSIEYKEEGSFTVQVSKFKNFLVLGQMPIDVIEVMGRATDMITDLALDEATRKGLKGSAYDNMVKIAREQIKEGDNPLTNDHIRSLLLPDAPVKDEVKILKGVAKTLSKLLEGDAEGNKFPSPQAETAFKHVENRLAELGAIENNTARTPVATVTPGVTQAQLQAESAPDEEDSEQEFITEHERLHAELAITPPPAPTPIVHGDEVTLQAPPELAPHDPDSSWSEEIAHDDEELERVA